MNIEAYDSTIVDKLKNLYEDLNNELVDYGFFKKNFVIESIPHKMRIIIRNNILTMIFIFPFYYKGESKEVNFDLKNIKPMYISELYTERRKFFYKTSEEIKQITFPKKLHKLLKLYCKSLSLPDGEKIFKSIKTRDISKIIGYITTKNLGISVSVTNMKKILQSNQ